MKHAGDAALDTIEPLLAELRRMEGLRERNRGVFYRNSSAFIHFHEDPAGIFADLRANSGWTRVPVNSSSDRRRLIRAAREILSRTTRPGAGIGEQRPSR